MVEILPIDIATEISLLSQHLVMPREGHLEADIHDMSHLNLKHNSRLVFDPTYPTLDVCDFDQYDWTTRYVDVEETVPSNAHEPLYSFVVLRAMIDSDHDGDKTNRRSRNGYFIWLNQLLIGWISKRQPTIESAVFGAEFVALKNVMKSLQQTSYKLSMMSVPMNRPLLVQGDNMSVILNLTRPQSTLTKKYN